MYNHVRSGNRIDWVPIVNVHASMAALTAAIASTAFVAEALYGLTTFGGGITFNVSIHLQHLVGLSDGTIKSAILALALPEFCVSCVQCFFLWRACNLRLCLLALVTMGSCLLLATHILMMMTAAELLWLSRALGLLLMAMVVKSLLERRRTTAADSESAVPYGTVPDLRRDPRALRLALACFMSAGLLGGLLGVPGPPLMLYVSWNRRRLCPRTWRATASVLRVCVSGGRLAYLIAVHALTIHSRSAVASHAVVVAAALGGLAVGNLGAGRLTEATQQSIILVLLVSGSVLLASREIEPLEQVAVWGVLAMVIAAPVLLWLWFACAAPPLPPASHRPPSLLAPLASLDTMGSMLGTSAVCSGRLAVLSDFEPEHAPCQSTRGRGGWGGGIDAAETEAASVACAPLPGGASAFSTPHPTVRVSVPGADVCTVRYSSSQTCARETQKATAEDVL